MNSHPPPLFLDRILTQGTQRKIFIRLEKIGNENFKKIGETCQIKIYSDKYLGYLKQRGTINQNSKYNNPPEEQISVEKAIKFIGDFELITPQQKDSKDSTQSYKEIRMGVIHFTVPYHPKIELDGGLEYLLFKNHSKPSEIESIIENFKQFGYHHVFTNFNF